MSLKLVLRFLNVIMVGRRPLHTSLDISCSTHSEQERDKLREVLLSSNKTEEMKSLLRAYLNSCSPAIRAGSNHALVCSHKPEKKNSLTFFQVRPWTSRLSRARWSHTESL